MFKDTPTQETLNQWEVELRSLLDDLKHGAIAVIEFGKPNEITSAGVADIFSRIRIRATQSTYTLSFVHVFYGEHGAGHDHHSKEPAHYPRDTFKGVASLIRDALAEVKRWTEDRARVGKNYLVNINEGLEFVGRAMDVYSPKADI
jgi:hypothetical protein